MAAFETDMARLGNEADRARMLLTALAWARGSGLPRDSWGVVACALAEGDEPGQPSVSDTNVRWLLRKASSWVVTDTRPGVPPVYRLSDKALAEGLRDAALPAEQRITDALLATVPTSASGELDWLLAGPYLRAHLAQHAAAAGPGALAALVGDAGFLAVTDPAGLTPLLGTVALVARDAVRAYRTARPLLSGNPRANAAHLQEATCALTGSPVSADVDAGGVRPLYRTRLAAVRRDDSLLSLVGHTSLVNQVAFGTCPDGRVVVASVSDDTTVRVWDPLAGELFCDPITGHTGEVWAVAFGTCPDGRLLLASASLDKTVRVWDPLTGAPVTGPITGHTERVYDVAFGTCPDGRLLLASGSGDSTARVWDPLTGASLGEPLRGHAGRVRSVAFGACPDGRLLLASGGPDGPVQVWDPLLGMPVIEPLTGHLGRVYWLAFCAGPDGGLLLMTMGVDEAARFWDPLTGAEAGEPFPMLSGPFTAVAFGSGADGQQLLACSTGDTEIHVWDARDSAREVATLVSSAGRVESLAFGTAPGGRLLLASGNGDQSVRIWDRFTGAGDEEGTSQLAWVKSLAFGEEPGGRRLLASASGERTLNIWAPLASTPTGRPVTSHAGWVDSVAFGVVKGDGEVGGGRLLLASAGCDGGAGPASVRVRDALTGALVAGPLTGHAEAVRTVAFGTVKGDGEQLLLASASDDGTIWIWDPLTGAPFGHPIVAHAGGADALAFGNGPDGRLLLASGGGDATVRIWDPLTGAPAGKALTGHTGRIRSVAFGVTAERRMLLASASDDTTVRLWDPSAGEPACEPITGHTSWVAALAFAVLPSGRLLLATGGGDRTVRVWDPLNGTCAVTIHRESSVRALAATGVTLAVGQEEGFSVLELDPMVVQSREGNAVEWLGSREVVASGRAGRRRAGSHSRTPARSRQ